MEIWAFQNNSYHLLTVNILVLFVSYKVFTYLGYKSEDSVSNFLYMLWESHGNFKKSILILSFLGVLMDLNSQTEHGQV